MTEGPPRPSTRRWAIGVLLIFVVLFVPPLVLVQGTSREADWPWLLLVCLGVSALVGAVPFLLNAWSRRFPHFAGRVDAFASGPWFWSTWLVCVLLMMVFAGVGRVLSQLWPTGLVLALLLWLRRQEGRTDR